MYCNNVIVYMSICTSINLVQNKLDKTNLFINVVKGIINQSTNNLKQIATSLTNNQTNPSSRYSLSLRNREGEREQKMSVLRKVFSPSS